MQRTKISTWFGDPFFIKWVFGISLKELPEIVIGSMEPSSKGVSPNISGKTQGLP